MEKVNLALMVIDKDIRPVSKSNKLTNSNCAPCGETSPKDRDVITTTIMK